MTRADDKLNVLILAAGLGTRLRPLTSEIPKPLVRVYDKSILEIQMERAKSLGDVRLHANAHYLADQIVSEARDCWPLAPDLCSGVSRWPLDYEWRRVLQF